MSECVNEWASVYMCVCVCVCVGALLLSFIIYSDYFHDLRVTSQTIIIVK